MDISYINQKLSQLHDYGGLCLYDQLPKKLERKFYVILYITSKETDHMGHFCILDNRNVPKGPYGVHSCFYFDSMGFDVDYPRKVFHENWGAKAPNDRVRKLIGNTPYTRNHRDFQSDSNNTCGDWCIFYAENPNMQYPIWQFVNTLKKNQGDTFVFNLDKLNII